MKISKGSTVFPEICEVKSKIIHCKVSWGYTKGLKNVKTFQIGEFEENGLEGMDLKQKNKEKKFTEPISSKF